MDETKKIIDAYNQLIYEIYDREQISCLSDNNYVYKGVNVLGLSNPAIVKMVKVGLYDCLSEITDKLKRPRFSEVHAENEIMTATADIKYRLGTMYLYFPYIVKLHQSYYYLKGERQYYYEQSRDDARFNREIPIAFESLYKYWQRLSDYLLSFFPKALAACKGVSYFHTPLDYILSNHADLLGSDNLQWLISFKDNNYLEFNKRRKFFVHTAGYDNEFFQNFLKANNKEDKVIEMDQERANILAFLKENLDNCLEGYLKMMAFLNELEFSSESKNGELLFSYSLQQS